DGARRSKRPSKPSLRLAMREGKNLTVPVSGQSVSVSAALPKLSKTSKCPAKEEMRLLNKLSRTRDHASVHKLIGMGESSCPASARSRVRIALHSLYNCGGSAFVSSQRQ